MNKPIGLNATGKVAVLTAIQKLAKKELEQARKEADEEAYQLYDSFGTDRLQIKLGETEVGTLSIRFTTDDYEVTDSDSFHEFCLLNGLGHLKAAIKPEYVVEVISRIKDDMPQAISHEFELDKDAPKLFNKLGDVMVLEGTNTPIPGIKPAAKQRIGTTIRGCDPAKVMPAVASLPGGVEQLLLGASHE